MVDRYSPRLFNLLTTVDYRSLPDIDNSTKHGLTKVVYPLTDIHVFYTDYLVLYYYSYLWAKEEVYGFLNKIAIQRVNTINGGPYLVGMIRMALSLSLPCHSRSYQSQVKNLYQYRRALILITIINCNSDPHTIILINCILVISRTSCRGIIIMSVSMYDVVV